MSDVRIERNGHIASVTLSNPGKLNALDVAMWRKLAQAFTELSADESLRCVIVRGDGGNFAAGADIEEFADVRSTMEQGMRYHEETVGNALLAVSQCRHPTVAAIEGACVGGGLEIACACDIRIAAPSARFGIPINRLGFPLAPGELQHFLALVGKAAALEILLEGRVFDAAEAKDKGLVQRIAEDVQGETRRTAERIAKGAPLAARMNKKLVQRLAPPVAPLTDEELREAFACLASQDYHEGVQSFLDKRPPVFSGK
jgi:enoyl-CoA hydratase/carnithine racemase